MIGSTSRHAVSVLLVLLAFVLPLGAQDKDSQKSLAPPQKLWAAQTSPNEVTLTWQPQTGIREFRILVAINQLAPVLLGSVGGSGSRYVARITDTGAQLMTFFIQAIAQV